MPKLISLYIRQILVGFGLSAVFVSALLYLNIGNLWHLISTSDIGWIAAVMLFMFHGLVFAGVQFAITIMRMEETDKPGGGTRAPVATNIPVPVESVSGKRRGTRPRA